MTRRRWIADEVAGDRAYLLGSNAEHLARVLRVRVGQRFDVATADAVREGTVISVDPGRVEFELGAAVSSRVERQTQIHLYQSVFKFDRMEWAIEKVTELGVASITPVIAARTEVHLASAALKRAERWRRIAREAAQQARRDAVPNLTDPVKLDALSAASGRRILLSETEREQRFADLIAGPEISVAIGPEGGWTEGELDKFKDMTWQSASLGSTILRAETAAIAAVAVASQLASAADQE